MRLSETLIARPVQQNPHTRLISLSSFKQNIFSMGRGFISTVEAIWPVPLFRPKPFGVTQRQH